MRLQLHLTTLFRAQKAIKLVLVCGEVGWHDRGDAALVHLKYRGCGTKLESEGLKK